jgi:probable rRNA maturation factor
MDPSHSRGPALAGLRNSQAPAGPDITILVADPAWRRALRRPEAVARAAAAAAATTIGGSAIIVLGADPEVKRLNARHRGRNKATNVLTFEPAFPGLPGEIVLALGTIRREAIAARRRLADHLAHLVVHGMLHLQGHDHALAGEARRMEMAESRTLARLRRPNPWKFGASKHGGARA